jgi:dienelactone hydrolase
MYPAYRPLFWCPWEKPIAIPVGTVTLEGNLGIPAGARGLVVFAHGTGSNRHSPRNRFVAGVLREAGSATLLTDLLTPQEEELEALTRHLRFNIPLLAERLVGITDHLVRATETRGLAIGYFGASTGAAAALVAAAASRALYVPSCRAGAGRTLRKRPWLRCGRRRC